MAPRGRHWLGLALLFVLGILAWVVARQTSAHVTAGELATLRERRSALEAQRATLQRRIRENRSRGVLIPLAEDLGLRLPVSDSEIVILKDSTRGKP